MVKVYFIFAYPANHEITGCASYPYKTTISRESFGIVSDPAVDPGHFQLDLIGHE
jgi:hypothetical protein